MQQIAGALWSQKPIVPPVLRPAWQSGGSSLPGCSGQVQSFHDEDGNVIVQRDQSGATLKDHVYMGGQHVAEFSGGQTSFVHGDILGSTRTVTDYAGNVTDALDYLPYGEQIAGDTFTTHKFTGKERDSESGLDNFGARYFESSLGRFMSADPGNAGANIHDPQSWNAYAYVGNSPATLTDPSGKDYTVCIYNDEDKQTCTAVSDDAAFRQALANPGPGIKVEGTTVCCINNAID
jgi:RHS repeat-associated protein